MKNIIRLTAATLFIFAMFASCNTGGPSSVGTTPTSSASDYVNAGVADLTAQDFSAAQAQFVLALAKDPTNVDAKVWKAFLDLSSLSVNPDIVSLFQTNVGFSGYPSDPNSLLKGTWFNKADIQHEARLRIYWRRWERG